MRRSIIAWCILFALLLCGCGDQSGGAQTTSGAAEAAASPVTSPYQAPEFQDSVFDASAATGDQGALIDLSHTAKGYVSAEATSASKLKFQVITDDVTYNYDLPSDGTPNSFVLQSGSTTYTFRVMENTTGNKYKQLYETKADVQLEDEFQPFLRPSQFVNYSENSACVAKAQELSKTASDELGVVSAVFQYVCDHITYDTQEADTVQAGYVPTPDNTLASGKGICFDYAALVASMLRSQGIPTKMIFGYVSPNDIYHAWNMFYTEETGWVTVDYQVSKGDWSRLDLTFSANGADDTFVGDGQNYTDIYVY